MRKPAEGEMREGWRKYFKKAVEQLEMVVIHGYASVSSGRSCGTRRWHRGKRVHMDIQLADLPPPFLRVGSRTKAHCGGEVEDRAGVNGYEGERVQVRKRGALDCDAERDERVVDCAASEAVSGFLIRTGDLEVLEIWDGGKGADERGDIGGGVKERRVLLHEEVGHFPAAIGGCADSEGAAL